MLRSPLVRVHDMIRLLLATGLFFLVIATPLYAQTNPCKEHHCIAVVDAGSTGSRVHIYTYVEDEFNSPIHIKEVWNKSIQPGFATLQENSSSFNSYLKILFTDAPAANIPVYFYATAGMRLLPQTKQKRLYNELKKWFIQQDEWQLKEAKTITGHEEGLYDWLSVNYRLGTFNADDNSTTGVMDIGGASVQIVFPVTERSSIKSKPQFKLKAYGKQYQLFVHSFLGIGQTEMSHQFLNSPSCYSNYYPLPDGDEGQGNAPTCEQEIATLLNQVHGVSKLIQPVLASNPVDTWYTIGGLPYITNSTLFHFDNNQLNSFDLLQQADKQVCHQSWNDLDDQFPDDLYMYQYCLLSSYYYALMVDGYGLTPEQTIHYIPSKENVDWTMGVVIFHSNKENQIAQIN